MDSLANGFLPVQHLVGAVAIVTGGSKGIGAQTVKLLSSLGSNVIIADLACTAGDAEELIASLSHPETAMFFPTNILRWGEMKLLFKRTIENFGRVDIVIANAGIMESESVFDLGAVDSEGELRESTEGFGVLDVNLKGTLNTLRLALYHMQRNKPRAQDSCRGSVILVTSTSGYFGSSGVGAYVASKHGLVGLLRASQLTARRIGVKVNAVAPFYTPTPTFSKLSDKWRASGLKANTIDDVAKAIVQTCLASASGRCILVAGGLTREMEATRSELISTWLGEDVAEILQTAGKLFAEGGYVLPDKRTEALTG
ncbi:hypothetical protein AYO21_05902 [Fonsecaea monophora]|uniref:Uncharacterized protein n=1 Tax=Fonsecaea monophora TaxID=254056 RepID=A0A177F6J5_9EURO|nr:hypothetical protein AYO21_05902 [Fonsecaea monophora]KAH0845691.1 Short-chain dehydrogenase reductase 3b [Fonsecaea pedrosoi]OAG39837.1 hypothetical protein AYO21_05902 [Fonsecaea monophora]